MTLFIRLDKKCDWVATGSATASGSSDIDTLSEDLKEIDWEGDIVALIPGERVLLTTAIIPSRQARHISQALPYAVEEKVAVDIEKCHLALGEKNQHGEFVVCINAREDMRRYLSQLKDIGLEPTVMTVDTLVAPKSQQTCITIEGEKTHIRTSNQTGFCAPTAQLAMVVGLIKEPNGIDLYVPANKIDELGMEIAEIETKTSVTVHAKKEQGLKTLVEHYSGNEINLLQGDFQVSTKIKPDKAVWGATKILAASTLVLYLFLLLAKGVYLDYKASHYSDEVSALFRDVYPEDQNVRDIRRTWTARLSGAGDDGNFLQIFGDTAAHIPGTGISMETMNYNSSRGDLVIQVGADRSETLVNFSATLNKGGLNAEIGAISQQGGSVRGSLKIRSLGDWR